MFDTRHLYPSVMHSINILSLIYVDGTQQSLQCLFSLDLFNAVSYLGYSFNTILWCYRKPYQSQFLKKILELIKHPIYSMYLLTGFDCIYECLFCHARLPYNWWCRLRYVHFFTYWNAWIFLNNCILFNKEVTDITSVFAGT